MVTAIIQARMSSSRLPGKVMADLCGQPVIAHIITRLQRCRFIDRLVLATSTDASDTILVDCVQKMGTACFRGDLYNVLARFYHAACENIADHVVRICADSPLLDWEIIDRTIQYYFQNQADIVKTVNMPLGLGTEIFSFAALEQAYCFASQDYQKEHVTPYIYENGRVSMFEWQSAPSALRLTLDTQEDFEVIKRVYDALYHGEHDFTCDAIRTFLKKNPEIAAINKDIRQVAVPLHMHTASDGLEKQ